MTLAVSLSGVMRQGSGGGSSGCAGAVIPPWYAYAFGVFTFARLILSRSQSSPPSRRNFSRCSLVT